MPTPTQTFKRELKEAQAAIVLYEEKLKRSLADYENLERRVVENRQTWRAEASASLVEKLLVIIDDLKRAQKALGDNGLALTTAKFMAILQGEGLTTVEAAHKVFDPTSMDCVGLTKGSKNMVVSVEADGYLLNGRVLRPAKVVVGTGTTTHKK